MSRDALSGERRGRLGSDRYTICIGAGIGYGLFPDWFELTRRVVERAFGYGWTPAQFDDAVKESRWSLDSWLQAAETQLKATSATVDFPDVLAEYLYQDAIALFGKYGLAEALAVGLHQPNRLSRDEVEGINTILTGDLANTTIMQLVEVLISTHERGRMPEAVITFNADSFIHLALWVRTKAILWQADRDGENPRAFYTRVYRGIDFNQVQMPIIHCHGALLPQVPPRRGLQPHRQHLQRLVFSESSYLRIAADMASWATTMFLYYAQTCRTIFMGLSFSDQNLRRWLNWSHLGTSGEISDFTTTKTIAPRHIMLTTAGSNAAFDAARDMGTRHLGVEVNTIPSWDRLGDGLRNLIAM